MEAITPSMLSMFLRCPHQFERRYLRGEIIPPGIAARRGSATHKAAQLNHEQKLHSQTDLPLEDLRDAARDHYVHLIKEEGIFIPRDQVADKKKLLAAGLDATVRLTTLYREVLAPAIAPLLVEERLTLETDLGLPLRGIIDVFTKDQWLPDLKTADKSKGARDADHSLQLTFYAGLLAHQTGVWPQKVSLEVLVNTKEPKLQSLITRRGPEDWGHLMRRVHLMVAQIEAGLFPPCDPSAWVCSPTWCGYFWVCNYTTKRN